MPYLFLPSVHLYYELHGPQPAQPLLLLHGAAATFHSGWRWQVASFSQHYRVIGVDLPGHGQSINQTAGLDLRQMADDMERLIVYLGYEQAHVCGFSGGASVALFLASRHPQRLRSLILVSNNWARDEVRTGSAQFWDTQRIAREQPHWWQSLQELHTHPPDQLLQWWEAEDRLRPDFDPAILAQITLPTLVVGGDRDAIIPLEQTISLYHHLPHAQLAILPGIGHGIPQQRAAFFNTLVLDFLGRLDETDPTAP